MSRRAEQRLIRSNQCEPTVTNVGGDTHIVEWQADPSTAETVFEMQVNVDLPALPNCGKMTELETQQIIGCH